MTKEINIENKTIWDSNARFWDEKMGAKGNDYHRLLISNQTRDLLNLPPGSSLLDMACGNGIFSRKMVECGMRVTAFDFSEENIKNARKYDCTNIDYHVIDATDREELMSLGERSFHGAAANMVLMDVPEIDTLFSCLSELLIDGSVFVFSIPHPCFNSDSNVSIENESIRVHDYKNNVMSKGVAIDGQPELQYYFHRPISELLNTGFKYGFVVNGIEEPVFNKSSNDIFSKVPPVMIVRMKLQSNHA